jgi:hypothetical protein
MTKWLKMEKARSSPIYTAIIEAAVTQLHEVGQFAKQDVLDIAGCSALDESAIRWDYVKRIIEEDHNTELMPLAAAFFRRHAKAEEAVFPERFIATGYGKKTVGFAICSQKNGHFVTQILRTKRTRALGVRKSADTTLEHARRVDVAGMTAISDLREDPDDATGPRRRSSGAR